MFLNVVIPYLSQIYGNKLMDLLKDSLIYKLANSLFNHVQFFN